MDMDKIFVFNDVGTTNEDVVNKILVKFLSLCSAVRMIGNRAAEAWKTVETIVNAPCSEVEEVTLWRGATECECHCGCPVDSIWDTWRLIRLRCDDINGSAEYYYKYILTKG